MVPFENSSAEINQFASYKTSKQKGKNCTGIWGDFTQEIYLSSEINT